MLQANYKILICRCVCVRACVCDHNEYTEKIQFIRLINDQVPDHD